MPYSSRRQGYKQLKKIPAEERILSTAGIFSYHGREEKRPPQGRGDSTSTKKNSRAKTLFSSDSEGMQKKHTENLDIKN